MEEIIYLLQSKVSPPLASHVMLTFNELSLLSVLFAVDEAELALAEAWTHGEEKLKLAAAFIALDFSDTLVFPRAAESSVACSRPPSSTRVAKKVPRYLPLDITFSDKIYNIYRIWL